MLSFTVGRGGGIKFNSLREHHENCKKSRLLAATLRYKKEIDKIICRSAKNKIKKSLSNEISKKTTLLHIFCRIRIKEQTNKTN